MDTGIQVDLTEKYLTPDELAKALPTLNTGKLAMWRHAGKGPRYRKVGKSVLYVLDEVIDWLESTARHGTGHGQDG
jgi:hypothetical protein